MKFVKNTFYNSTWKELLNVLDDALSRNERRFNLIQKLDREIQNLSNNPVQIFDLIFKEGLKEVNADYGHVIVKQNDELEIKFSNHQPDIGIKFPIDQSLCGDVLKANESIFVEDVKRNSNNNYYQSHSQTKSEFAMPIIDFRGKKLFGILNLEWKKKTKLSYEDKKFIELLNGQLAIAMEQIKLWEGVRMISDVSIALVEYEKGPEEVYALILEQILSILNFDLGQILLVDGDNLVIVASSESKHLNFVFNRDNSVCGHYLFNEKGSIPLKINDLDNSKYLEKYNWLLGTERKAQSEFVVPLLGTDNKPIGVINIEDPAKEAFSEFDEFIIGIFGRLVASAIEGSTRQKTIKNMQSAKDFDFIFAYMGHMSINFLHSFGGNVANAIARLSELKRDIKPFDESLPTYDNFSSYEFLDDIINHLSKTSQILNNFRDKLQPENLSKDFVRINLISAISNALERAKKIAAESRFKNVDITFNFLKDDMIDKRGSIDSNLTDQFNEILDLLLFNAMEAFITDKGDITVTLKLDGLYSAEIIIKDNGSGMTEDVSSKIFDFGFTTKNNTARRKGEGIGLWFSKIYFHRFGGDLNVRSELGVGTTFVVNIPVVILD